MAKLHSSSVLDPTDVDVARLAVDAARRAEAMGLVASTPATADADAIRRLANQVRRAGIGISHADVLNNVEPLSNRERARLLELIIAALDASPAPEYEWQGLTRLFSAEDLAALLQISASSVKRYQSSERDTPDHIAARLHFLALVVGDLAGSYNATGVRRWFQRKRTLLGGQSPAELLTGEWDPDDEGPARVRELARRLVTLTAT